MHIVNLLGLNRTPRGIGQGPGGLGGGEGLVDGSGVFTDIMQNYGKTVKSGITPYK